MKNVVEPAPNNCSAIVKQYKDRLDQFNRRVKERIYKEGTKEAFAGLLQFLTGETDSLPGPVTDNDESYLRSITSLLAPYAEWTFIEHRTLAFMTQEAWSLKKGEAGLHRAFYEWLAKQLQTNDYPGFFNAVINELSVFGIKEELSLQHSLQTICRLIKTNDGQYLTTSFNDFVLQHVTGQLTMMIKICREYDYAREYLIDLLLRHQVKEFEQFIPEMVAIEEYNHDDGNRHIRYGSLEKLCAANPEKYEQYAMDLLQKTDCQSCKAEIARILKTLYGDKHRRLATHICRETLEYISQKKNKDHQYRLPWSGNPHYGDGTPQFIEWIITHLGSDLQAAIFDYVQNTEVLSLEITRIVVKHFKQEALDMAAEALNMTIQSNDMAAHYRQLFTILAPLDYSKYYDKVWDIARSAFKDVRQTACLALSKQNAAVIIPKAKELLQAKKAHEREAGILILGLINTPATIDLLKPLLQSEKNDDARDIAVGFVYKDNNTISIAEAGERIAAAKALGKLEKPAAKWIDEKKLPALTWSDGKTPDTDAIRFLLYRQTRQKAITPDPEAKAIYTLIDKKSSGDFAKHLLDGVIKNGGAKAQNRFALAVIGLLGDERIIQPLQELAIKGNNENACTTLGLQDSWEAARALDNIMQAFRTKYPNVRAAAKEAFDNIADTKGISPFELMDKMIPDFGFTGKKLVFTIGKDNYEATITHELKLIVADHQQNIVKTLPKATPEAIKKKIRETGAAIGEVAKQQTINIENYLVIQRKWEYEQWTDFFLINPLAFAFAQNLVWGIYTNNKLTSCFCVQANGNIETLNNETVSLTAGKYIGLVHPLEMAETDLQAWKTRFDTAGIKPPFDQLNRQIFRVPAEDKHRTILYTYENRELNGSTFKTRAQKLGWRRGSVIDGGGISTYRKNFPNEQVEVFIATNKLDVTYDHDEKMSLGSLYFVKTGSIVTGSYTYDEPRNEQDPRLIRLSALPPIVYSEAIADIEKIIEQKENEDSL